MFVVGRVARNGSFSRGRGGRVGEGLAYRAYQAGAWIEKNIEKNNMYSSFHHWQLNKYLLYIQISPDLIKVLYMYYTYTYRNK